jgi:hypothetical protein
VQVPYKRQFPWSSGKLLEYLASGFISFLTNKQVVVGEEEEEEDEPSRKEERRDLGNGT